MNLAPWSDPLFLESWPRLFVAAAILIWGWSSARAASRRLFGAIPWDLEACAASTILAVCLVASGIALGALGLLRDWTWAAGAFATATTLRAWAGARPPSREHPRSRATDPSAVFSIALSGLLVGRMVFGVRNPPADVDTIVYHLPMVAHWMRSGSLGAAMSEPPIAGAFFPGNGEVLQMWAAWAAGRETLMPWTGLFAIAVLAVALRRLGLLAGASGAVAEALALCVSAAPGVVRLTLGTRIDTILAAWFAVALLFALRFRRGGASADLAITLSAAGLLAGSKATGPVFSALVLAIALIAPDLGTRLIRLLSCRVSLLLALLTGGFWFARNALATGNPLFPAALRLGPWTGEGLIRSETLSRTSQVAMWAEGYAGHFTLGNLARFYGPAAILLAIGLGFWIWFGLRARGSARRRRGRPAEGLPFGRLAAACLGIFLIVPYSGASLPAGAGLPPALSTDNMRYLLPAIVCAVPLAALGLSRLAAPGLVALAGAAVFVLGLWRMLGHVLPGIAVVAAVMVLANLAKRQVVAPAIPRLAVIAVTVVWTGVLALSIAAVEPMRDRLSDRIWDGFIGRLHNLPAAAIRDLRESARGRPIACVGVYGWWAFYDRDFSGSPVYVPVGADWRRASRPYHFKRDRRDLADRNRWLENLDRSGAAFVVVGAPGEDCLNPPVERAWCAADTTRFRLEAALGCDAVFAVLPPRAR